MGSVSFDNILVVDIYKKEYVDIVFNSKIYQANERGCNYLEKQCIMFMGNF